MDDSDESLERIAALLDELKNEDIQLRKNATRKLKTVAAALGHERTRGELIPFLTDTIDDEDEVLLVLAEELGDFVEQVGGVDYAETLLSPLESLSTVEETVVRDRATKSLNEISRAIFEENPAKSRELHSRHIFPLVRRLSQGDWFTSRISAASLLPFTYRRLPPERQNQRKECLSMFAQLTQDDTPMVRRAVASHLGEMAQVVCEVNKDLVGSEIVPLFKRLAEDEEDSVRLMLAENLAVVAQYIQSDERDSILYGAVQMLAKDKSWRVRYRMSNKLFELTPYLDAAGTRKELLPTYLGLMRDTETEVRTAAAFNVANAISSVVATGEVDGESGVDLAVSLVMPAVKELAADPSQHVRAALAANVMGLARELGPDITLSLVLEIVLLLLKDEYPDVRLNVIGKLADVTFVREMKRLSDEMLPAIMQLADDRNWRVRLAMIEHIRLLAEQLGRNLFSDDDEFSALSVKWLNDHVWSIREAAIANLKSLAKVFGADWAKHYIVPRVVKQFKTSEHYLYRMTALNVLGELAEVMDAATVQEVFVPLITEHACRDAVPNIRFGAANTLVKIMPHVTGRTQRATLRRCLEAMVSDGEKDRDVKFFAQRALAALLEQPSSAEAAHTAATPPAATAAADAKAAQA